MPQVIALLRAVNVGGRTLKMGPLRDACRAEGLGEVQSHLASGNLLLAAKVAGLEARLETLIATRFGLAVPVLVRTAARWAAYLEANPFPEVAAREPARLVLLVSRRPPASGAMEALQARAAHGEVVGCCADALAVHYPAGQGTSKLTPALVDRLVGSPTTARNWNTVVALARLVTR
jgi:uncharacterized protein (DUF1697 family)